MRLIDEINRLKKYRESVIYYRNNEEKISASNMKVSNGIVYISPLNDMKKHIEYEVNNGNKHSILERILIPQNGGYAFIDFFILVIFVIILLAMSIMLAIFMSKGV